MWILPRICQICSSAIIPKSIDNWNVNSVINMSICECPKFIGNWLCLNVLSMGYLLVTFDRSNLVRVTMSIWWFKDLMDLELGKFCHRNWNSTLMFSFAWRSRSRLIYGIFAIVNSCSWFAHRDGICSWSIGHHERSRRSIHLWRFQ